MTREILLLLLIISIGTVGIIGLAITGAAIHSFDGIASSALSREDFRTTLMARPICACAIERFDYYGSSLGIQIQSIYTGGARVTDAECQTRCQFHFGRGFRRYVTGIASLDS